MCGPIPKLRARQAIQGYNAAMRRLWMLAALTVILAVPSAFAQRRGGSIGGGGAHMGSFSHGAPMISHGGSFAGAPHSNGVSFTTSYRNPYHYAHGGYGHGYRHRFYGYGYGYPSYGLYGYDPFLWGSSSSYDNSDQYGGQNQQLSQQVNELSNEVARLRDEQEIRASTPLPTNRQAPPDTAKANISDPTVLVFRDQHREEIRNYAVVGRTLWVFNEDRAKKIPLTDLDVPATIKVNDDRGVDFNVPR